jgi:hypothetical protein
LRELLGWLSVFLALVQGVNAQNSSVDAPLVFNSDSGVDRVIPIGLNRFRFRGGIDGCSCTIAKVTLNHPGMA